jgi:hypothetical protein
MEFVFVFYHLRPLPVVLDACPLERELFDFDGDGTAGLGFDYGNVVFTLCEGICRCVEFVLERVGYLKNAID